MSYSFAESLVLVPDQSIKLEDNTIHMDAEESIRHLVDKQAFHQIKPDNFR